MIRHTPLLTRRKMLMLAAASTASAATGASAAAKRVIQVSKDPNCGCCSGWVEHLRSNGWLTVRVKAPQAAVHDASAPESLAEALRASADLADLTSDQVLTFFAHATAILPEELHTTYNVVPCQYSGSITINGTVYEFSINAGAFGVIRGTPPQRVALFGCKAECNGLFRIRSEAE